MNKTFSLNSINFYIDYPAELGHLIDFFSIDNEVSEAQYAVKSEIKIVENFNIPSTSEKLSNTIFRNNSEIVYFFDPNLSVTVLKADDSGISATIEIRKKENWKHYIKSRIKKHFKSLTTNIYVQALRHAILYPYFLLLNQENHVAISHGSAFCINDKCYVILGFDGIGKSTIANEVKENGGKILTDNFVIFDNDYLYFVPDPLRTLDSKNNQFYGKKLEKISFECEKKKITSFIYTYLGQSYIFKKKAKITIDDLNYLFTNYLPEFYDFNRYLSIIKLSNLKISFDKYPIVSKKQELYECQRASLEDNRRLIHDILSV